MVERRADAFTLFDNYTKRNSVAAYVQSHGAMGTRIINQVNFTSIMVGPQGLKHSIKKDSSARFG